MRSASRIEMRIVAVLAACALSLVSCQTDCALPDTNDVVQLLTEVFSSDDSPGEISITVEDINIVCLAHSQQQNLYRYFSAVVHYTCTGTRCPSGGTGTRREQIDSQCVGEVWRGLLNNIELIQRINPVANLSTVQRDDCIFCFSPDTASTIGGNPDNINHCVECNCNGSRCYQLPNGSPQCCNVYFNNQCAEECPTNYIIEDLTCVATCEDLGNTVSNGVVQYSPEILGIGRYSVDTTATVSCNNGFGPGGVITCQSSGNWSDDLPLCDLEDCGSPPSLTNGIVLPYQSTTLGAVVTYQCNKNYTFEGSSTTRTCLMSSWSNVTIKCVGDCGNPPPLTNGRVLSHQSTTVGAVVTYQCNDDYIFTEDSSTTRRCLVSGWSNETIICSEIIKCEIPNCKECVISDGKPQCQDCADKFEKDDKNGCSEIIKCEIPNCKECVISDGKPQCQDCADKFEKDDKNGCSEIDGGSYSYQSPMVVVASVIFSMVYSSAMGIF